MICCTGDCRQGRDCPHRHLPRESWIDRHLVLLAGIASILLVGSMLACIIIVITH